MGLFWQVNAEATAGEPFVRSTHKWNLTNVQQNVLSFFAVQFNTTICILLAADMLNHTINKVIFVKKSVDRIMNFMQSSCFMIGSF